MPSDDIPEFYDPIKYAEEFLERNPPDWQRYYLSKFPWTPSAEIPEAIRERYPHMRPKDIDFVQKIVKAIEDRKDDIMVVGTTPEFVHMVQSILYDLCPPRAKSRRMSFEYGQRQFVTFYAERQIQSAARGQMPDALIIHPEVWWNRRAHDVLMPILTELDRVAGSEPEADT